MKRIFTKALCLVCAGALALSLAACGGKADSAASSTASSSALGSASDYDYQNFNYSDGLDEKGYWEGIRALDYVTLPEDFASVAIKRSDVEPTSEEVEEQISDLLSQYSSTEHITDRAAADGDTVNINYVGSVNNVEFTGGSAENYDLTLGSGTFIDGFEDGLIGKKIGDTVDLNLTFPEDYSSTDLAGKEVVFTVKINSVKRAPKLTDELAAEISNNEYKTAEAYNNYIKEDLENTKKENQHNQELNDLVALAYQNATVNDYPQEMIDYQLEQVTSYYKSYADQYGMEYADFLEQQVGMTEEEFVKKMTETVKQSLGQEMVLRAIAETEGVEISDEKFQEKASKYAAQMGSTDVDAFISQYGKSTIMASILQDEAVEILEKNAVVKNADGTLAETTAETETETASK